MDRGAWKAAVHGVAEGRTRLSGFTFTFMHWRRKWQPTPCSCLENPRDGGAWWAAIYGVAQSRIRLKRLSSSSSSKVLNPFSFLVSNKCKEFFILNYEFIKFPFLCLVASLHIFLKVYKFLVITTFLGLHFSHWGSDGQVKIWSKICVLFSN